MNKFRWGDFTAFITKYDIVGFVETWAKTKEELENMLPGYICFSSIRPRRHNKGRHSGGVSIYVRQSLVPGIKEINCSNLVDSVFINLSPSFCGLERGTVLGVVYIPPENSIFHKISNNLMLH